MSEGRRGHAKRAGIAALLGAAALVLASTAAVAQETTTTTSTTTTTTEPTVQPAAVTTFTKTFTPVAIVSGGTSTLTFDIITDADDSGIAFTDSLPAGMEVATTATTPQCGGAVAAAAGSGTITFTGGAVNATTCTITVEVTATNPGDNVNTTSAITWTSNGGGSLAGATATLNVLGFAKSFSPDTIDPNGISTLTFTFDNTGNPAVVSGLTFTDTLPTTPGAMVVASTPNASTDCTSGAITAAAGSATIGFSGGSVPANATCIVQVDVTAPTAGTYDNGPVAISDSSIGGGGAASASLVVTPLVVTKTFVEGSIPTGGTATFNISIRNDGSEAVNDVVADDPLATACNRTFTTIAAGATETYTCTLANVTTSFTNTITVTGTTDPSGVVVSAVATAAVTVGAAAVPAAAEAAPALALTGSSTGPLTGIGLGIVALGSLLVFSASNRRRLFRRS